MLRQQPAGDFQTIYIRQVEAAQDHVDTAACNGCQRVLAIGGLAHDAEILLRLQHPSHPDTH